MAKKHIDIYKLSVDGKEEFIKRTEDWTEAFSIAKDIWNHFSKDERNAFSVEIRHNYRWDGISPDKMIPGCIYPGVWKYDIAKKWTNEI